ncbi:MAG: dihydroneopterin aldolase [Proteobacteria bacterium]|nr:dihydroneopterin aldolase [Pseudomonadota bacterium]
MSKDRIQLSHVRLHLIIGILPAERLIPQPVDVGVDLELDLGKAAVSGNLIQSVDYGDLLKQVSFILHAGHFYLLETAALALVHFLLTPLNKDAQVSQARVSLSKREAPRVSPAIPKVTVARDFVDVNVAAERIGDTTIHHIFSGHNVTVQRLHGNNIPTAQSDSRLKARVEDMEVAPGTILRVRSLEL